MLLLLLCLRHLTAFNATRRVPLPHVSMTLLDPPLPLPSSARLLSYYNTLGYQWEQTGGTSGKIVVPWTVSENYPVDKLLALREAMALLEDDVGCMEYPEVERDNLAAATWLNGIVFIYENEMPGYPGCYSLQSAWPGWIGTSGGSVYESIEETGAPSTWQLISLADGCQGGSVATIQHEVLHALGFPHTHQV